MKSEPVVLAVSGVKNSGKTRLIEALLPLLAARGVKTAVVKHDGHRFTPDTPGTDSFRFFAAGAVGSAVFDGEKFSLTRRAAVDENGYLPTHNRKFSQAPTNDPVWNAAHCRNRRLFNDRTGAAAGRSGRRAWRRSRCGRWPQSQRRRARA